MEQNPVVAIAEEGEHALYKSLVLEGERIETVPFSKALSSFSRCAADFILLDSGYQVQKGLHLLKEIKTTCSDIPVIFFTSAGSEEVAINAFRLGARDYFRKPFDPGEVQKRIEGILRYKRAAERKRVPCIAVHDAATLAAAGFSALYKPRNIQHVVRYIQHNLTTELRLSGLAREAHLSKYHFCRIFKQHVGVSPKRFIINLRIEKAKELLVKEEMNVSLAALEAGFNDLSNFIKEFKKYTGITPTAYRSAHRKGTSLPLFPREELQQ
ncbi:MAG: DNA-binding response regulator [Alphaproteobacteria bacterium]|uniref:DNA-binding response regulator n=1 Tax=Candidatus Nitrobium versatile TaxID=2884831 RepID=A0A953JB51_9BACT|nr:DNA-binding response regulator [Candidatus Nitrobium versatile]